MAGTAALVSPGNSQHVHADEIGHDLRVDVAELAVPRESGVVH
jgi:hypothetical protein